MANHTATLLNQETALAELVDRSNLTGDKVAELLHALGEQAPYLLDCYVIICPGGRLYDDGDAPADSLELLRPVLYSQSDAARDLERLERDTAALGLIGWHGQIARLGDLASVTGPADLPDRCVRRGPASDFAAPHPEGRQEWAIALPGGQLYRDSDAVYAGMPHRIYDTIEEAQETVKVLRAEMDRRAITDYTPVILSRTVTTSATIWAG
ncbi:hypothetical protein [Nocardia sp. NPDC050435]|uniref:hypothetical protein n=1 Tax=Nocardia sp. NPDC050435 TaxID=3155040 RepID=UPI0033C03B69